MPSLQIHGERGIPPSPSCQLSEEWFLLSRLISQSLLLSVSITALQTPHEVQKEMGEGHSWFPPRKREGLGLGQSIAIHHEQSGFDRPCSHYRNVM